MALRRLADRQAGPPRCAGCPYVGRTCGTRGPEASSLVIIGEAPGSNEIAKGVPFIGQSGVLLERTLRKYGYELDDAYITNAMVCRPRDAPPPRAAIEACRSRLANQVAAHPRELILVLGNSALRSLTGNHKLKITSERGKALEHELGLIVPTFHPANILRNANEYPKFARDIEYAVKLLGGAKQKTAGDSRVTIIDTEAKLLKLAQLRGRELACDIETSSLNPRAGRILSLGLAYGKNQVAVVPEHYLGRLEVKRLFADKATTFIWHNGKYDAEYLRNAGYDVRVDEDTMLMHYSLDENKATHDLGQLATELLGAPDYKAEFRRKLGKKRWAGVADLYDANEDDFAAELHRYNALDCDSTLQLFRRFRRELAKPRNEPSRRLYYEHLLPASDFLQAVQRRGLYVDRRYLRALKLENEAKRDDALERLMAVVEPVWDPEAYLRESTRKKRPKKADAFKPGNTDHVLWLMNKVLPIHVPDVRELTLRNAAQGIAETAGAAGAVGASRKKREDLGATWAGGVVKKVGKGGEITATLSQGGSFEKVDVGRLSKETAGQSRGRSLGAARMQDVRAASKAALANVGASGFGAGGVEGTRGRGLSANRLQEERAVPLGVPILQALLDWREARKNLTTWIYGIERRLEPDGRIHSTFNIQGTETGRLSSSDPNLQNIPVDKHTRNMFAAAPGNVLIEFDYGQAELRLLAHLSGDEWLKGIYQTDRDLHTEVALHLYGEGYSYQQRMRAKAVNFGIAYGRTAYSLMGEFGISQAEAQRMVDEWFERAPRVKVFLQRWRSFVKRGITEATPFGRRRRFAMITGDLFKNLQNEAANFPMQSTASDLTLVSAMRIDEWLGRSGLRRASAPAMCGVINLVHDSILIECPKRIVEKVRAEATKIMMAVPLEVLHSDIPFTVDSHSARAWGDCK